eukprot:TRINITY_DN32224_c0_g1_i1.p1 TRINITY_DN32224_c0_g1~~TRINITY_DN32224_c0_g1_i1.p1  ORF type:complete len:249 (+),score=50.50 TRINITY_DN32224_c0_g1_i1:62-808(+)
MSSSITLPSVSEKVEEYLAELKASENDPSWEQCAHNSKLTVWRKMDTSAGLYRVKMAGRIPADLETCYKVLLDPELRQAWDKIVMEMHSDPLVNEKDPNYDVSLVYTAVKAPLTLSNRDFIVQRAVRDLPDRSSRIVFDISVEHPNYPPKPHFIRATTLFSGLLLEPCSAPCWETKQPVPGTTYQTITLVDVAGDIPKTLVNLIAASSTVDWFDSYSKACKKFLAGTLLKSPAEKAAKKEKKEKKDKN